MLISSKKTKQNRMVKSALKTSIKKFNIACGGDDAAVIADEKRAVQKAIDKAVAKGVIHKNNAARKKSAIDLRAAKIQ